MTEGLQAMARANQLNPARNELLAELVVLTARDGNTAGARSLLDRGLRLRGTPDEIAYAESGLLHHAYERAQGRVAEGRIAEAIADLRALEPGIRDAGMRAELASRISMLEGVRTFDERAAAHEAEDPLTHDEKPTRAARRESPPSTVSTGPPPSPTRETSPALPRPWSV